MEILGGCLVDLQNFIPGFIFSLRFGLGRNDYSGLFRQKPQGITEIQSLLFSL